MTIQTVEDLHMPVLLLCQGEQEAKDRLRAAIQARYGPNPPAIEKITIAFSGRARVKIGPVGSWVPVEAQASFVFPDRLRWDFTVKPLRLPVQKGIEVFDGKTYRYQRAIGSNKESVQTDIISSARSRLWQMAAILLTPMSDYYIKMSTCGQDCIIAENTKLNDSVHIFLRANNTIDYTVVNCINPDSERIQKLTLRLSEELITLDGLILPKQVNALWDNEDYFELSPTKINLHPDLPDGHFTLESEHVRGHPSG